MDKAEETKFLIKFGRRLAKLRKEQGLTQAKLSQAIGITIVSLAYLETGKRWPRPVTLQKLAKRLNVSVADLFKDL